MVQPDFLVIGHVAKDLIDDGYRPGGTVVYSALTARNLGRRVGVITSASADLDLERILEDVQVVCLPSSVTTTFRNVYDEGGRRQYLYVVAEQIEAENVPLAWRKVAVVHLAPIAQEVGGDIIDLFSSSLVGLTPQGWLRQWSEQGCVFPCQWVEAGKLLPRVDVLILSEEDLAGEARTLRSQLGLPRLAVVTKGAAGATVRHQGAEYHFPARKTKAADPTGAGDIFAAAFLVRLAETDDPLQAARFANLAASLSVERTGVASVPGRAEIEALMTKRS